MNRCISLAPALLLCTTLAACNGDSHLPATHAAVQDAPAAALRRSGQTIDVPESSPLRQRLQLATVEASDIERPLTAPGVIEAAAEKLVKIAPPVPGRVVRLHRSLGDTVKAGDPLFTLDSAEVSTARSDNAKAQATVLQARRDFERQKRLFDADIAAKKEYETAQLIMASAESDARAASDRLAQLGTTADAHSRRDYVLRSPISGRVVEMAGAQGGYWNDINAPIMTVADLSTVWLSANVAERDIGQLMLGQQAHITLNAYPHQTIEGRVRYIGELLDPETRSIKVRVAVENRDGRFRPGMFARVAFNGPKQAALTVPASALLQNGLATRVFVEKAAFSFEPRTVTVGVQMGERIEVLSGLQAGERIVVKEGVLLND